MNLDKFNKLEETLKKWEPHWNGVSRSVLGKDGQEKLLLHYPKYKENHNQIEKLIQKYWSYEINLASFKKQFVSLLGELKYDFPADLLNRPIHKYFTIYDEAVASSNLTNLLQNLKDLTNCSFKLGSLYFDLSRETIYYQKKGINVKPSLWSLIKNYKFYVNYPGGMSDEMKKEYKKIFDYLEMTPEELEPTPEDYAWGIKYIIRDEVKKKKRSSSLILLNINASNNLVKIILIKFYLFI